MAVARSSARAMAERPAGRARRPSPAIVAWGSVALFAILFALLTYQLSAAQPRPPRPVVVRKVLKKRIVTTIVPTPGPSSVSSSGAIATEAPSPAYAAPVVTSAS